MLLLLDKHCPRVAVKQKQCRLTPWFDAECRKSRHVTVLERRYRRSRKKADNSAWLSEMKSLHALYEEKNRQYWCNEIADSKGDSRRLRRTMSGITGEKQTSSDSGGFTADEFVSFLLIKWKLYVSLRRLHRFTTSPRLQHIGLLWPAGNLSRPTMLFN